MSTSLMTAMPTTHTLTYGNFDDERHTRMRRGTHTVHHRRIKNTDPCWSFISRFAGFRVQLMGLVSRSYAEAAWSVMTLAL